MLVIKRKRYPSTVEWPNKMFDSHRTKDYKGAKLNEENAYLLWE